MTAIKTGDRHETTWNIIHAVLDALLAQCNTSPYSSHLGGRAISQPMKTRTHPPGRKYARRALLHKMNLQSSSQISSPGLASHN